MSVLNAMNINNKVIIVHLCTKQNYYFVLKSILFMFVVN